MEESKVKIVNGKPVDEYDMLPLPKIIDRGYQRRITDEHIRQIEEGRERRLRPYIEESDRQFATLNRTLNLQTIFGAVAAATFFVALFVGVLFPSVSIIFFAWARGIVIVSLALMLLTAALRKTDDDQRINLE